MRSDICGGLWSVQEMARGAIDKRSAEQVELMPEGCEVPIGFTIAFFLMLMGGFIILATQSVRCYDSRVEFSEWYTTNESLVLTRNTTKGSCPVTYGYTPDGSIVNALTIGTHVSVQDTGGVEECCHSNLAALWITLACLCLVLVVIFLAILVRYSTLCETPAGILAICSRFDKALEAGHRSGRVVVTSILPKNTTYELTQRYPELTMYWYVDPHSGYFVLLWGYEDVAVEFDEA